MSLGADRRQFTHMLALLILHIEEQDLGVAADFLKRCDDCPIGEKESLHKSGLAIDLNLYREGTYLSTGEEHKPLHDFWDDLGGNERINNDLNHYSYAGGGSMR